MTNTVTLTVELISDSDSDHPIFLQLMSAEPKFIPLWVFGKEVRAGPGGTRGTGNERAEQTVQIT